MGKEEEVQINFMPYLVEALATNRTFHREIDRLYKKDKTRYYELAKNSPWYNHPFITTASLKTEIYARRSLGLLEGLEAGAVISLLRKGWPRVYNVVSIAPSVGAGMISQVLPQAQFQMLSDDEANGYVAAIFCLGQLLGKPAARDQATSDWAQMLQGRLQHVAGDMSKFSYATLPPDEKGHARQLRKELLTEANTAANDGFVLLDNTKHPVAQRWREALEFIFDTENVTASILDDALLTDDGFDEITSVYNMCFPDKAQAMEFFVSGIFVKRLIRSYGVVKQQFWANTAETVFPELDSLQRQVATATAERNQLQQANRALVDQVHHLTRKAASEYNSATAEKQNEIRQLTDRVKDTEEQSDADRRELAGLRDLLFGLSASDDAPSESESGLAELGNVRGLIAGGHERWQQRMKTLLPNFSFLHTDVLNFDPSLFRSVNVVFIHSGYISHTFYSKVMAAIRSFPHIDLQYLHATNPDVSLREIVAATTKER
ncbi:MAG: hypothetical protein KGZ50_09035 [Peptococcaceae bacterium]|nr:hypothetical protein [Peptococcaceae bacterium]